MATVPKSEDQRRKSPKIKVIADTEYEFVFTYETNDKHNHFYEMKVEIVLDNLVNQNIDAIATSTDIKLELNS